MSSTDDLSRKINRLAQESVQRSRSIEPGVSASRPRVPAKQLAPRTGKVVQLPIWREDRRGVPNDLVRSALFTIGNSRQKRVFRKSELIAALGDLQITYTGEELRQDDEDVFLQLVHLARLSPLGNRLEFTAHSMLKALRWATDSRAYKRLRDSIDRLCVTGLSVASERTGYTGSLVRDFTWQQSNGESSRRWKVRLEPKIIALFGQVSYTQIEWEQRLQLGNLAKWLHSFYYTHTKPYPMKVKTIHLLCGSTTKNLSKFRQMLRFALQELSDVEFLSVWRIEPTNDLVHVERKRGGKALTAD